MWISKIFTVLIFLSCSQLVQAQDSLLSVELQHMHRFAETYVKMENYKMAIATYKQLIELSPENIQLKTELGDTYFRSGDYDNAIATLSPLQDLPHVTYKAYEVLAAAQLAQHKDKLSKSTVERGLARFPDAGALYYLKGTTASADNQMAAALQNWFRGIELQPRFAANYKAAALAYLNSSEPLWGILYGETYLAIPHDSTGNAAFKTMLYNGWSAYFEHITDKHQYSTPFEEMVRSTLLQLTPIISDGMSVENLTMVRTRFLMEWSNRYATKYPFPLFTYQEELIRNGLMDTYSEWLLGMAESKSGYEAWNKFHTNDMHRFEKWREEHFMQPAQMTIYVDKSDEKMDELFPKKKKR